MWSCTLRTSLLEKFSFKICLCSCRILYDLTCKLYLKIEVFTQDWVQSKQTSEEGTPRGQLSWRSDDRDHLGVMRLLKGFISFLVICLILLSLTKDHYGRKVAPGLPILIRQGQLNRWLTKVISLGTCLEEILMGCGGAVVILRKLFMG